MKNVARTSRLCAALFAVAIAASCADNQPASPNLQAVAPRFGILTALSVDLTPAGPVPPNVFCTWTAHVSGGTSPFHYQWKVNNSNIGIDSQFLSYRNNGSAFRIQVFVTDAASGAANDSKIISVSSSFSC